mmetsp:Transcript_50546/g.108266  ORF Transcript_50546/g.108266 Transcript_50546/m.108266 type:complete len:249 (-) Transcript_50546:215-961(-)
MLCAEFADRLLHREAVDRDLQLILIGGFLDLLVRPERTLRHVHERLVEDRENPDWVIGDPERQLRAPGLHVSVVHIEVPLSLLGHPLDLVRIYRLLRTLGCELLQEHHEAQTDLSLQTVVDVLACTDVLACEVVVFLLDVLIEVLRSVRLLGAGVDAPLRAAPLPTAAHRAPRRGLGVAAAGRWAGRREGEARGVRVSPPPPAPLTRIALLHGLLGRQAPLDGEWLLLAIVEHLGVVLVELRTLRVVL